VDDLVRWLRGNLDKDAARAIAAAEEGGPGWRYDGHAVVTQREGDLVAVGSQDFMEPERGEHVAEWDPARVLREIDAKRQIVDRYAWLREHGDTGGTAWVLQTLALPFADRPGYREEWGP
jgi:Family of unknown function (DUF6221)